MALNNQLPLSAPGATGSLSDILPDLQDLMDVRDSASLRKSLGAVEQAAVDGVRQFIQRGRQLPPGEHPAAAPPAAVPVAPPAASSGLWGPIPTLDLQSQGTLPQQLDLQSAAVRAISASQSLAAQRHSSMPVSMTDFMPYASFLQAQAALSGLHNGSQLWQRLMQAPGMQQQVLSQLAQQGLAMHRASEAAASATEQAGLQQLPASQPSLTGSGIEPSAAQARSAKRTREGSPKTMQGLRSVGEEESGPSSSGVSDPAQAQELDRRRGSDASTAYTRPGGGRGARTQRQQIQNKQAQQRYRERRRLKVAEMEEQLGTMSQQVSELRNVLKQNVALQDKVLGLELQLAEKAKAVEEVASLTSSAEDIAPAPAPEELGELKMELQNQIMKLESLVSAHRLRDAADPRLVESGLERPVQEELVDAVANCLKLCARAEAEGLQIGDLLTRSRPAAPASLDGPSDSAWPTIIQGLRLDESQVTQLVARHQGHLQHLGILASGRATILQQVSSSESGRGSEVPESVSEPSAPRTGICSRYTLTAQQNLSLLRNIQLMKESLQKEAKVAQQYTVVVTSCILRPVQAALLVVDTWPAYCDTLAFTTALVTQHTAKASSRAATGKDS